MPGATDSPAPGLEAPAFGDPSDFPVPDDEAVALRGECCWLPVAPVPEGVAVVATRGEVLFLLADIGLSLIVSVDPAFDTVVTADLCPRILTPTTMATPRVTSMAAATRTLFVFMMRDYFLGSRRIVAPVGLAQSKRKLPTRHMSGVATRETG